MGCFALKGKPCGVIAHVIDQDVEPEEWAEVYEALSSTHAGRKQAPQRGRESLQGLFARRQSSQYQAIRQESAQWASENVGAEQLRLHGGWRASNVGAGRNGVSDMADVQLLLLSAKRGLKRKG